MFQAGRLLPRVLARASSATGACRPGIRQLPFCIPRGTQSPLLPKRNFSSSKQTGDSMKSGALMSWKSTAFQLVGIAAAGTVAYFYVEDEKSKRRVNQQQSVRSAGLPSIGGSFSLTDNKGKPCTEQDFAGKYVLLYFGFTFCPDVCPAELEKMSHVVDMVSTSIGSDRIVPVMITVDPLRDNPAALTEYLEDFHPTMIGLTGSYDEIKDVCRKFRVYFSLPRDADPKGDYLVDHSIFFYLMDKEWNFLQYYGQSLTAEKTAKSIIEVIEANESKSASE